MKNKTTTAVEITGSHIKVVQALPARSGMSVVHCDVRLLTQQSDSEISKILSGMIRSIKIKPDNIITAVPRRFTILRHISLPSHSDQEIDRMINLQVAQQIPYPKEDVVLDYIILDKIPSGYAKILVIAVHKDVVNRYLKIFNDSGLPLNKLTLSSAGLSSWYIHQQTRVRTKDNQPVAIINIDTTDSEICFCHRQKILFARSISLGAKDLNAESMNSFIEQIGLTMMTYMKEEIGAEISKVNLVSNISDSALLKDKLEAEYRVAVEIIDPFNNIPKKRTLKLPLTLNQDSVSVAVSLGFALLGHKKLINLLPAEIADTRKIRKQRRELIKLLILFIITGGLAVSVLGINLYKNSIYLQQLQAMIDIKKPEAEKVKRKLKRLEFIKERFSPGISSADVIYELYKLTPEEVSFSLLYLDENDSLTLKGVSMVSSSINTFQNNLVKSPLFEDVTVQYVTKRKVFKGELTDFKIICRFTRQ